MNASDSIPEVNPNLLSAEKFFGRAAIEGGENTVAATRLWLSRLPGDWIITLHGERRGIEARPPTTELVQPAVSLATSIEAETRIDGVVVGPDADTFLEHFLDFVTDRGWTFGGLTEPASTTESVQPLSPKCDVCGLVEHPLDRRGAPFEIHDLTRDGSHEFQPLSPQEPK